MRTFYNAERQRHLELIDKSFFGKDKGNGFFKGKQYPFVLRNGGNNLSGGQKQRIAIARTLLVDNKFIIFDAGMGGCYVDSKGTLLSIPEMRELIIYQKTFYIRSIGDINSKELAKYWAKNLVRFQSHMNIKYGNERRKKGFSNP